MSSGALSSCSNTSAGSITQLVATGAMDAYLSKNAKFTYWKSRHQRFTQFAMEAVIQPFNSVVQFGQTSQITLNRTGDLVYYMYVLIEIPGITACRGSIDTCGGQIGGDQFPHCDEATLSADCAVYLSYLNNDEYADPTTCNSADIAASILTGKQRWAKDKYGCCVLPEACSQGGTMKDDPNECIGTNQCGEYEPYAYWSNSIGQLLVKCASIVIGGTTIDSLYNDFLFCWEELTGKTGKKLEEMVGKRYTRTQLVCDSRCSRVLYVPLPFWFTTSSGSALSLASLNFHGVQVHIEFERLQNCIIASGPDVQVKNCASACCLTNADLAAALETTYIYLDSVERAKFASMPFETLIVQLQHYTISASSSQIRMQLNFNHPVLELIWVIRRQAHEQCNNWFDYSGIDGRDPVVKASLYLNNQPRFQNKPGPYLRMVQNYQYHTNVPDAFIYVYSFALHPEELVPSGTCNFSRIDHVDLVLQLQEGLARETVSVMVFARNFNILRFREGLAGVAYSN